MLHILTLYRSPEGRESTIASVANKIIPKILQSEEDLEIKILRLPSIGNQESMKQKTKRKKNK